MKGKAYTAEELETMHDFFVKGAPLTEIAERIGKSAYAVLYRMNQLSREE